MLSCLPQDNLTTEEETCLGLTWLEGSQNPFFRLWGQGGRIISVNIIRKAILSQAPDFQPIQGGKKVNAPAFGGRPGDQESVGPLNHGWIFGIEERSGQVRVELVFNLNADVLSGLGMRKVGRSNIVYTNRYQDYDSLVFGAPGPLAAKHSQPSFLKRTIIHEQQGFRGYARKKLIKFRGISPENFFLFLKELEFRYNQRKNG